MPNWCSNELEISGKKQDVVNFLKKAKGDRGDISLEVLVPIPEGIQDPYQWFVSNWGTKWDLCEVNRVDCSNDIDELLKNNKEIENKEEFVTISFGFETAWSPPLLGFTTVSENFPNLNFKINYEEQGSDYCGVAEFENGMLYDKCVNYTERFGMNIDILYDDYKLVDDTIEIPVSLLRKVAPLDFDNNEETSFIFTFKITLEKANELSESMPEYELEEIFSEDGFIEYDEDLFAEFRDHDYTDTNVIEVKLSENWQNIKKFIQMKTLDEILPKKERKSGMKL